MLTKSLTEFSPEDHVLVGVSTSAPNTNALCEALVNALQATGFSFDGNSQKILSGTDGTLAAEFSLRISSEVETARAAFSANLSSFSGDWALLPAHNRKKDVLICDMDSTIIAEECLDELADFAGLKAEISAITERAMAGELNFEEALTTRVGMLAGLELSAISACYADRIHLNPGAQTLVATMQANGADCQLVSGGFTDFTSRVAAEAGFTSHHANTLENDGTKLTGKVGLPILGREAKLDRLKAATEASKVGLDAALCMGDGANDLAMIEAAGLGIAYRAKPIVAARAHAAIDHTDLTTALFFQGYERSEFRTKPTD